ncbi:GFA family protein [Ruegeria lacuscaerulensis]|uniref:GFA family protein n=1 Tax=Ruegeria lacuscaerulensis TaxID=55218 RepID=UPI00147DF121|nr:GFA family protein [Ruegeria lacuscaerulensis]
MTHSNGTCSCGQVHFKTQGRPLFRAICHCTICQRFNDAEYGDILLFRAADVDQAGCGEIVYESLKQPPLLARGRCTACGNPALEKLNVPLFPKLILVPSARIVEQADLPSPDFHIFYNHRVREAQDDLPKSSGYLPSQARFTIHLLRGLFRGHG